MPETYERFFSMMEEVGYFDHIYENLPPDFTAVFEIARILENVETPIAKTLAPAMTLQRTGRRESDAVTSLEDGQIILGEAEEYVSEFIRSPRDLPRIYIRQWLLPDEVFYARLAMKELWVPYVREPTTYPVVPDPEGFNPDEKKQKVYILLDTSSSMGIKNRIDIARAIVYRFLRQNMKELGYVNLRTFDVTVGELHTAEDEDSYRALIAFVMRRRALGNGTAMAAAIMTAARDIRSTPGDSGAEILIVTDGACALNETAMRELMGDRIVINTVKIGRRQFYESKSYIRDLALKGDLPEYKAVRELHESVARLRELRDAAQAERLRRAYTESLHFVEAELDRRLQSLTGETGTGYGHELERLSTVFIQVQDIELAASVSVTAKMIEELEETLERLMAGLEDRLTVEAMRKLGLFNDHLVFLLKSLADKELRKKMEELLFRSRSFLSGRMQSMMGDWDSGWITRMSAEDRHDLEFLFAAGNTALRISMWKLLFLKIASRFRSVFSRYLS